MKLTDNIYLVGGGTWGGMGLTPGPDCNLYLLDGGDGALALVDTGAGVSGSPDAIAGWISRDGFDVSDIGTILLTHMHGDHVGGAAALAAMTKAEVFASPLTARVLAEGDVETSSIRIAREAGIYPADFELTALAGVKPIEDGATIAVGHIMLTAIATPGHCEGHLSFLASSRNRRDLLAGDVIFWRGRVLLQAIEGCDVVALSGSIERLAALGSVDGLFPGHGAVTLSGATRHINAAAEQVRALRIPPGL
jgi:glyoxylase-like metal-dependent hydrolase (beta-lactamase superfamily II)